MDTIQSLHEESAILSDKYGAVKDALDDYVSEWLFGYVNEWQIQTIIVVSSWTVNVLYIVQFIFYFWSFEISVNILRNRK